MIKIDLEERTIDLDVDRDMRLTDETLDDDLCELARKIAFYAQLAAECQAFASRRRNDRRIAEARAAQVIREDATATSKRTTEPGIAEKVVLNQEVIAARMEYYRATAQHTMVDGFYRALREKASLGIALCYKQKEEIRVTNSPIN